MKHIKLNRTDLQRDKRNLNIDDITVYDFKASSLPYDDMCKAETITFVDSDGTARVLKTRYSILPLLGRKNRKPRIRKHHGQSRIKFRLPRKKKKRLHKIYEECMKRDELRLRPIYGDSWWEHVILGG